MYKMYIKRFISLILALLLFPAATLLILILGLFVKLEDRGPIFYCAPRLGRRGRVYQMYKLRSMKLNAPDLRNSDGSTFSGEEDPRLTKIGKWLRRTSLDELPQLFNIIKGEMCFIGPRPDLPEHLDYYVGSEIKKLNVLPGVTGYNQAYFRNSIVWKQRLQNDVYYVEHVSFLLDVRIFIRTIISVALRRGIHFNTEEKSEGKVMDHEYKSIR